MQPLPNAPTAQPVRLRGDYRKAGPDYTVDQRYDAYEALDHLTWRDLWRRQVALVNLHAAPEFIAGVQSLGVDERALPDFGKASRRLHAQTGWRIVAVPGLIPEQPFFEHLAARRFPVTVWMRRRDELDYLVEPDLFHDFFGHVPLLTQPVFADFMQAYGKLGCEAASRGGLKLLARLYWYLVEFGLIRTTEGLKAYGAGILSSAGETRYSIESPVPQRIAFDLERVLSTDYLIDDFQRTYFVLDDYAQLIDAVRPARLLPLIERLRDAPSIAPGAAAAGDVHIPAA